MNQKTFSLLLLFFIVQYVKSAEVTDNKENLGKLPCTCRASVQSRIVNGRFASSKTYPWLVSIQSRNNFGTPQDLHGCGATIINESWLLTASHCLKGATNIRIAYGVDKNLNNMKNYIEIDKVVINSKFKEENLYLLNDIGLIKLKTPINFVKGIAPACFNFNKVTKYPGVLGVVGWGSTEVITINLKTRQPIKPVKTTSALKEGDVYDVTDRHPACKNNPDKIICTYNDKTGDSACKGDSGGPLHLNLSGKTYVIGVSSFAQYRPLKDKNYINLCDSGAAIREKIIINSDIIKTQPPSLI